MTREEQVALTIEATAALRNLKTVPVLQNSDGTLDYEAAHGFADKIVLEYLDEVAPDVAAAYRELKKECGTWRTA